MVKSCTFFFAEAKRNGIIKDCEISKERKFIGIYNDVIHKEQCNDELKVKDYEMPLNKYKGWRYSVCNAFISPSESILYGLMVIGLILLGGLI